MNKPVHLRAVAANDIELAVDHDLAEAGAEVAARLVDVLERDLGKLARQPHFGSLRFAYELGIPDLRAWPVQGFPFVVFYVEQDQRLDVWRVLKERRDIPASLAPPQG